MDDEQMYKYGKILFQTFEILMASKQQGIFLTPEDTVV